MHSKLYMERLKRTYEEKVTSFVNDRERALKIQRKMKMDSDEEEDNNEPNVNPKDARSITKWMDDSLEGFDDENETRRTGLLDLFRGCVRGSFDYLRCVTTTTSTLGGEDEIVNVEIIVEMVASHLQFLLSHMQTIFNFDDGSWTLEGCLAGSLLLKDPNIEKGGDNPAMLTGYDQALKIMEIIGRLTQGDNNMDMNHVFDLHYDDTKVEPPTGASKLSRFLESAERLESYGGGVLREARCVVTALDLSCTSIAVEGDILAASGTTGYKHRSPWFGVSMDTDTEQNTREDIANLQTGFYEPGYNVACSHQLRSVACMADRRIKIFDVDKRGMPCRATLQAKNCQGPLFVDDKLLVISSTNNDIHLWRTNDLKQHESFTLEDVQGLDQDDEDEDKPSWLDLTESSWNDDVMESPENIDVNVGELPHLITAIQGLPPDADFENLEKVHDTTNNTICLASARDPSIYIVDLHQGKVISRLLGHLNLNGLDISTSSQMPNLLMSTRGDNHARLWDLRCHSNTPILTLVQTKGDTGSDFCCLAEDMIAFTSARDQCVRAWDFRAPSCLYKLSTGNTRASSLAYSSTAKTLFAVTNGFGCSDYHPPNYFPREWNAYTKEHCMSMQHRAASSHLITYEFKDEMNVNLELPVNHQRESSDCDDDDYW
eukprot:CAMPEP_0194114162 /NCGR_PEP_ID=MMETSP0150-20130528/19157_1 /TAXON_ID=122233 /ORGANISM="Chaetoceros debilis, Strain MM31A-1" /LENGTH=658 /DNA_ID=CAMNT_0038804283 /DNA_START=103 /DNA_END=2079 /DNA_ORIENTATION=+